MSGLGDGYRNKALDAIFGIGFTKPATLYVALLSTAITASNGSGGVELAVANGYARAAVTNNSSNWGPAAAGQTANLTTISYSTVTGTNWLTVVGVAIYDNSVSVSPSNLVAWGTLLTPRTYTVGQTASFPAGSITIALP